MGNWNRKMNPLAGAVTLALFALLATQVADAGPGIAPVYSANAAPPPAAPDTFAQTFFANSPQGPRPDLVGGATFVNGVITGPTINTGTALRKFVDILPSVPGLAPTTNAGTGTTGASSKYLPLATPSAWPTDGADYYHLAIVEYAEQMHSDLPKATTLRGYVQIEEPGQATTPPGSKHIALSYPNGLPITLPDANGVPQPVYAYDNPHYLGPVVLATKDKPIRVKYSNLLPIGGATDAYGNGVASRNGDLFIPVDATLPGGALPQNRAEIHLHGGLTPWISDGTPHQWTLPVGDPRHGYISDIAITAVGAGYTSPVVTIDPPQSVASGILATVNSAGQITAIVVTNGGANYTAATAAPSLPAPGGGVTAVGTPALGAGATAGQVVSIGVTIAGSGYASAPAVTLSAPTSTAAQTGTAILGTGPAAGTVASVALGSAVAGYASVPAVTFSAPPPAVSATATATLSAIGGGVSSITPSAGNYGYFTAPAIVVAAPAAAVPASASATLTGGVVTAIAVNANNFGYWSAPTVTLSAAPIGVTAAGTASINATDHVSGIAVTNAGAGYTAAPVVTISAPAAAINASAGTATLTARTVTAIAAGTPGFGYWTAPAVTVAAPAAAVSATGTATVVGGRITAVAVNATNFGYWAVPSVTVAAPPAAVVATATVTTGKVVTVSNPGADYVTAPAVTVTGGTRTAGRAWRARATIANGVVTAITITGTGVYSVAPRLTIAAPPASRTATLRATINAATGTVTGFSITNAGRGYATAPTITVGAPAASVTATATATIAAGKVTGYTVVNRGTNYLAVPGVSVAAAPASVNATATAVIAGGSVASFTITNPGTNYTAAPTVTVAGAAGGKNATASATIANGVITGFTISGGSGYTSVPTVTISAPTASVPAAATATVSAGVITGFTVTTAGVGYTTAPTVTVPAAATSVTATGTAVLTGNTVTSVTIINAGSNYATAPTIIFPVAGIQATATATIANGAVSGFTVTNPGAGYLTAPAVTVAAPAGIQAAALAVLDANGRIIGFNITNPGSGYATAPVVTVGWPAGALQATATATQISGALAAVSLVNAGGGYTATPGVTVSDPAAAATGGAISALMQPAVGASFRQVPDMTGTTVLGSGATVAAPVTGEGTLYWTNNQTERLMFFHDHTSGTTRLNVYAGEAAGYVLNDPKVEPALPIPNTAATGGGALQGYIPEEQIPLVIQDRTFVPADVTQQDVNWDTTHWGTSGDLWFPHVYETNQNPAFLRSLSNLGRWDWGPWFAVVYPALYALPSGAYGDVTTTPEAYQDTMVVNGTAYPTLTVEPRAYRLRVLNAANDRFLNLGFYQADTTRPASWAANSTVTASSYTEVSEVANIGTQPTAAPFAGTPWLPWPTDGRTAPAPDTMGPPMISIGNEAGLLPQWVQHDAIPVNYDYNRRSVTVLNVSQNNDPTQVCYPECHGLYLGPAERADVVVDFAQFAGKTLILYNDAPAPNPGYDTRIDYYTDEDSTDGVNYVNGGAHNTAAGYGPNTRTILQVIVGPAQNTAVNPIDYVNAKGVPTAGGLVTWNPNALGAGRVLGSLTANTPGLIQNTYAQTQAAPIVGEAAYNIAFNPTTAANAAAAGIAGVSAGGYTDQYGNMYLGSQNQPEFYVTNPGPLTIQSIAVTGNTSSTGAASGVGLGNGSTGTNGAAGSGTGYTTAPAVLISPPTACLLGVPTCALATATATIAGGQVTGVTLNNAGAGYTEVPSVTFVSTNGKISALSVTNGGSGYSAALPPAVTISGGGGTGALAMASVNAAGAITGLTLTTAGTGYGSIPTVSIAAPTSIAASGTATLSGGTVSAVALTSGGTYSGTAPTVSFSAAPAGAAAVITPTLISVSGTTYLTALTITSPGSGYQAAPAISLSSACGGTGTTTLNANGGIASITLTGIGIGGTCAAADTVVLSTAPVAGVIAAATATLDSTGATVIGVTITNPGSGYATAPTVSFSGGVQATASAAVTGGGYGATAVAIASTTQVFITPAALPGNAVPPTPNATPVTLTGSVAALLGCSATSCSNLSNAMVGRLQNPAIQELFEPFYGRMNATLGVEMPNQSLQVQTTLPLNYVDPGTEMWEYNQPVMWKITHNGVDAHPVHFHLLNVQVVNRVGWDGTIKAPEDDEIGWKETVKMNPLEDVIVVMRPTQPQVPFGLDRSIRADDPSQPLGVNTGFTQYSTNGISGTNGPLLSQQSLLGKLPDGSGQTAPSPAFINAAGIAAGVGGPATVVNALENFDNEYVWHCHILGHEENDFMRAISVLSSPVAPAAPTAVAAAQTATGAPVVLTWVDATPIAAPSAGNGTFGNPANELGFKVLRSVDNVNWTLVAQVPANATTAIDPLAAASGTTYYYQVVAYNAAGSTSTPVTYKGL